MNHDTDSRRFQPRGATITSGMTIDEVLVSNDASRGRNRPLVIDLFCGLGGWAEGFLSEGYDVVGFDIERHDYGTGGYPGQLVIQDVLTLHGSQFRNADVIVASPPCQAYSYRAMPWKRAKALPPPSNELFDACFRIQREACEAAKRYIPLVVENVRGAQPWVGRAAWSFGSYYLWGDVPALMPIAGKVRKSSHEPSAITPAGTGKTSWFFGNSKGEGRLYGVKVPSPSGRRTDVGKGARFTTRNRGVEGIKFGGGWWHDSTNNLIRKASSRSIARKAASAQIAKIPFPLAQHTARCYLPPVCREVSA